MRRITFIILTCIVVLGSILRIVNLQNNPPGFFADEAVIGADAYSLIHQGTDHAGHPPNFLFSALGDYRGFVQIVSAIPWISLFGLNEFAIRFTSVVYGIGTIILMFGIATIWFGDTIALLSAFFLATAPWHIHMSRLGFEEASFPFWLLLSLWLLLKSIRRRPILVYLSGLAFGITLYTYQPARLFVPLFVAILCLIYRHTWIKREKINFLIAGLIFFALTIPLISNIFSGETAHRFQQSSVLFESIPTMQKAASVAKTYINYFSLKFLFTKGDAGFPGQFITRHSLPGLGLLSFFQLPFLLIGLVMAIRGWKKPSHQVLLGWLVLYPIAGALVGNTVPFATRGIIGVIPMVILTAIGIDACIRFVIKKSLLLTVVLSIILMGASVFSINQYLDAWRQYPQTGADYWGWQYGARPVMDYFLQHRLEYDEMYMSDEGFNSASIFIPFYDPTNLCNGKCRVGRPDRYNSHKKQLFAIDTSHMNFGEPHIHVVQIIYYPNDKPAFFMSEISQ